MGKGRARQGGAVDAVDVIAAGTTGNERVEDGGRRESRVREGFAAVVAGQLNAIFIFFFERRQGLFVVGSVENRAAELNVEP